MLIAMLSNQRVVYTYLYLSIYNMHYIVVFAFTDVPQQQSTYGKYIYIYI